MRRSDVRFISPAPIPVKVHCYECSSEPFCVGGRGTTIQQPVHFWHGIRTTPYRDQPNCDPEVQQLAPIPPRAPDARLAHGSAGTPTPTPSCGAPRLCRRSFLVGKDSVDGGRALFPQGAVVEVITLSTPCRAWPTGSCSSFTALPRSGCQWRRNACINTTPN